MYNTIVIGGGAAGLFLAQHIGKNVLVLEKNNSLGRKLLASGSRQCNFTHNGDIKEFFNKYGDKQNFVKKCLNTFSNKDSIKFFSATGMNSITNDNGKVFPKSLKSEDILNILIKLNKFNTLKTKIDIKEVNFLDNTFRILDSNNNQYFSENLVVATGGITYPKLGASSFGYELARQFGHTIIEPAPALTNVIVRQRSITKLTGLSFKQLKIISYRNNKKVLDCTGDLIITHKGLSGPIILDNSRNIKPNDILNINFLPQYNYENLNQQFIKDFNKFGTVTLSSYLKIFNLPKSLLEYLCEQLNISKSLCCAQLIKSQRKELCRLLTMFPIEIEQLGGINIAMVTAGGVCTKEIYSSTFESKLQKNLYFIGEVLDVDGNTGGYNIQFAFSSAYSCGKKILKIV
ncbi:hypothetical protein AN639_00500 [Candidatus Epulonipiscium fishelsonii]|uniref:Uncharacterized protein n=1 Tax=Candidatus Epulonipiscium fishelsonii TaxID=77094 RepID=A0ACC8XBB8_9FIRM|nr:hypothetical protein AN396_07160 [Epulopiscium sp. SCG-B11WGA-EpuloA1]ONI41280.1 hypothetical protein AN639_00500 [Epulopiscium sp. SCG-B05WGA-EpuloA1]